MAAWDITTAGANLNFDTGQGINCSCLSIDSNHFINFWRGTSDYAYVQVFTVNTSTWEINTAASSLIFNTGITDHHTSFAIDSNHFINFSTFGAQVFTVNTSTWAVTTAGANLVFDTSNSNNSCFAIDSNHFINFYTGLDSDGYVQVFTVDTSTWAVSTASAKLEFDAVEGSYNSCFAIDSNHFINFWAGSGFDGFVQVFTVDTSTWAVTTAGSRLEFDTVNGTFKSCYRVDQNHFINFWRGASEDGFVQVFTVNTSTWAVTTANTVLEFDTIYAGTNGCYVVDTNHFINLWTGNFDDGYSQVFTVNTSTWAVTTAGSSFEFDTSKCFYPSIADVDPSHFITFYSGPTGGHAQVLAIELPSTGYGNWVIGVSPANIGKVMGVATANILKVNGV